MVVDCCSMTVQKTCSAMLVIANEATDSLSIPCQVLDGVTLLRMVVWWDTRHNVSSPRKVLHLVDMELS